ncbi:ECF transporter S component [Fructilactobacillus fructivorans]|uniref:Substrate-specific component YkoE of thiamin-regulated ECF transporter for HydroxyMethylPyrimidine n=1 Tax=Fructilactobacillus fructivorans TaxID=1614 RepID=A0A0C1M6Q9_9LACO|nr:ECF transporter S component [Fructilactobacillus fructivorans]KID41949.1 Substrate-specific component YkoE of thiamin-regulated ECF transporter for HydroxyMethylPyrimidine [Fructilactobacillus fructivorans]MCT0151610.1 ABC transporter permease [Fructilactobacillus fructivorans]MCT2867261.1 ABC transporter permease [Fructilactobacillus fructivorans]MCT2868178.1 ABC transporter permease [Fructilactobacillus fructivorans]MCT2872886.1 ABC transporter permease [Fructilactobacillus fructivorans]
MKVLREWHLKDIILVTLIGAFCGVIFWGTSFLYNLLAAALTPFGLQPFANEATFGLYTLAGPLAAFIIRLPFSATLGEFLGAFVEMILGSQWGVADLLSGLIQGLSSELGFAVLGYKHYDWLGIISTTITTTVITFAWDMIKSGYANYHIGFLLLLFLTRLVSVFLFSGVLTYLISRLLEKSQVLSR